MRPERLACTGGGGGGGGGEGCLSYLIQANKVSIRRHVWMSFHFRIYGMSVLWDRL